MANLHKTVVKKQCRSITIIVDCPNSAAAAAPAQAAEYGRWVGASLSTQVATHTKDLPFF